MNTTMQSLMLDRIQQALTTAGLLHTLDFQYGNTGAIRVLDDQTLAPSAEAWFKFGDEGCDFYSEARQGKPLAACYYEPGRYKGSAPWCHATPAGVIATVVAHLTRGAA